jgi:putative radical SAM enzyme (TIGR03279 family)
MTPPGGGVVAGVRPGSLADEAGIEPGDTIVSVAGHALRDVVDLQFHQAGHEVVVQVRKANGLDDAVLFEKAFDEDLGLEFERPTWDDVTLCNNNCFFCFLKGLPKGMRKTLYTKDDDYRLSFLHGNFVTLTNLTEADWERLEEQRLSPLNVSVHATELELRRHMLSNPRAPHVLEQLERLGRLGIRAHSQIVLCPGVNDGPNLDRSVRELGALYPTVQTISVVPVGASPKLEDWSLERDGIELVRPSREYAGEVVAQVRRLQRELRRQHGKVIVQCSDEYYVTAGASVPSAAAYDGYPQYENGIGMVRRMQDDWLRAKRRLRERPMPIEGRRAVIASGTLAAPLLQTIAGELNELAGTAVTVVPITNQVFGERVNVTGLLCGQDYLAQLRGMKPELFILPRPSLDYFGQRFLDNMTIEELERELGAPITFATLWSEVVGILRDGPRPAARNNAPNGAFWSEPSPHAAMARA